MWRQGKIKGVVQERGEGIGMLRESQDSRLRCEGGEGRVIVGGKGLLLGRENGKVPPDDRDLN